MGANPTTPGSRNIVRLVIFAVALPSLLLTGMGILAISNEEAAARRRLTETYQPVEMAVARKFNDEFEAMQAASGDALRDLVAYADGDREDLTALERFVERYPHAVNFFVAEGGGDVLFPRDERRLARPSLSSLRQYEKLLVKFGSAVGVVAHELGRSGPVAAPEHFVAAARDLARALADPALPQPSREIVSLARGTAERLAAIDTREAGLARLPLEDIAGRAALLAFVPHIQAPGDGQVAITHFDDEGTRRLVLVRQVGGEIAGFEVVPAYFSEMLTKDLHELGGSSDLLVEIMGLHGGRRGISTSLSPTWNDTLESQVVTYALLKRSDLAWQLAIMTCGKGAFFTLTHSRVPLYIWLLVLIVAVLTVGIALTIREVVREAKVSRLKTDFVSSVSHDLRTPLTSIRMFTEMLLMGRVKTREEERECLEVVAQETERLSRLTERILDFARMEAGRKPYSFTRNEVPPLVEHALAASRPLITEKGFEVQVELEPGLPPIEVDRDAIIEAIINLVTNAVKYSPDEKQIRVAARRDGEGIAIAVSDRGIGIPRAEHGKIFEMFYRVDCKRTTEVGGSGIGLSLVKHIVDAHHGRITVDSAPGQGSTFTIHLPPSPAAVAEAVDGEHSRSRGRSLHREGPHPKPAL